MTRQLQVILYLLLAVTITAQDSPRAHYSFDGCNLSDATGLNSDAGVIGSPACICGVQDTALALDGSSSVLLPEETKTWLANDYSISFYFRSDNTQAFVDLVSIRKDCTQDSTLAIRFINATDEVELLLALDNNDRLQLRAPISTNLCWHQVTITKSGLNVSLYVDELRAVTGVLPQNIPFSRLAALSISNSGCLGISDARLNGVIDELKLYDYALSRNEIVGLYLGPDQIISNDTTIFAGASVPIRSGSTCSSNITWSPTNGLNDDQVANPIATPTQTTTYFASYAGATCTSTDSITVFVQDSSSLDCDNLLLPNAFTPNNDSQNDVYGISNPFIIDSMDGFEIRDRWGSIVFSTTDKNEKWDGRIAGQAPNPGTYLYTVRYTCSGEELQSVGSFILMR